MRRGFRHERAPRDLPVTADCVQRAFAAVALRDEYQVTDAQIVQQIAAPLRRWDRPVRVSLEFGDSVSPARPSDCATRKSVDQFRREAGARA